MNYLGIDVGKRSHVASMIDEKGKILLKAFTFTNTIDGAESLVGRINNSSINTDQIEIGMETTGHTSYPCRN